ncbi:MAG TPA: creatininase family protein [Streptosporangiaceae bacterium]|nr:creatininase family protein [Streptosporangiaceae bacterium]
MTPLLARRTSPQVAAEAHRATLVIPVGATEQHGPHLPVWLDSLMAEHVAQQAARRVHERSGQPILVAPLISYGSSHHHLPRAGTLSLRSTTLHAVLDDLLDSAADGGFRSLVLLNGHGGNQDIVHQAVRDLTVRRDVRAAATSYWTPAWERLVDAAAAHGVGPLPGHAGSFETSIALYLWPDLVDAARVPDAPVTGEWDTRHPLSQPVVEQHDWVHRLGGYSDGAVASAAAGRSFTEEIITGVAAFLERFCADAPAADTEDGDEPGCDV